MAMTRRGQIACTRTRLSGQKGRCVTAVCDRSVRASDPIKRQCSSRAPAGTVVGGGCKQTYLSDSRKCLSHLGNSPRQSDRNARKLASVNTRIFTYVFTTTQCG